MRLLVHSFIFFIPLYCLGLFVGGKYLAVSHLLAGLLGLALFLQLGERKVKKEEFVWAKYFLAFIAVSLIGILISPYAPASYFKGVIQLIGIIIMISMATIVIKYINTNPMNLMKIIKMLMFTIGLLAAVGIAQFIIFNLFPQSSFLSFDFLNTMAGGSVWRDPGYIGPIHRVASYAAEPTAFGRYLCLGLGLALIRLGVVGKVFQEQIRGVVPLWSAICIVAGVFVSFSINAWLMSVVVLIALVVLPRKISSGMFVKLGLVSFLIMGLLLVVSSSTGDSFASKFATIALVFDDSGIDKVEGSQLSALAVATNITVSLRSVAESPMFGGGLGSHASSYKLYAPRYTHMSTTLDGLNSDDAASLLFRLISESGVLGTIIFLLGLGSVVLVARKRILLLKDQGLNGLNLVVTVGLSASCIGMFELYLTRTGHYYDPAFWFLIALTVASSRLLLRKRDGGVLEFIK